MTSEIDTIREQFNEPGYPGEGQYVQVQEIESQTLQEDHPDNSVEYSVTLDILKPLGCMFEDAHQILEPVNIPEVEGREMVSPHFEFNPDGTLTILFVLIDEFSRE